MKLIFFGLAIYFAFGYAIERENRIRAQKKIDAFYENSNKKLQKK